EEILVAEGAHCVAFEGGALAALWGIQPRSLRAERGILDPAAVEAAIQPENDHLPRTRAIAIENTFNRGGGAVWPVERVRAIADVARRRGVAVHLDGARLANAAVATGASLRDFGALATTVSLCLSKGLGAPVGSLVASSRERVREMRRLRKRLGGGWRQAGILAAAGLHAIDHHVERLAEDHANARLLAARLAALPGVAIVHPVDTNMVFASFAGRSATSFVAKLREVGVLCNAEGARPDVLRLVTHLDVDRQGVVEACGRIEEIVAKEVATGASSRPIL
ncbi:MAG TPA: GntG family PLP-dependent aldolase, partial [Anaeromyxobacteraceae bacterium]|nr:GntG family PLP-dependent aldolase [Anaeromyxobacteraceae bacterium]